MTKKSIIPCLFFLIFLLDHTFGQIKSPQPNIVLILADDMGYSDLGAYGSEIKTPNLDRLAREGIRFTQMHNTSKCFPSRAVLLTGLYAEQVGMNHKPEHFTNGVFLGEILRRAGYRTLMVGKHHGTDNPYEWGFDHYRGLRDGAANYFNPGFQRVGEALPAQKRYGKRVFAFDDNVITGYTPPSDYYGTKSWTDWALDLLSLYEGEDKPFFLYLSYQAPHDPLQAPEEEIQKYKGRYDRGYEVIALERYRRQREMGLLDARYPRSETTFEPWEKLSDSVRQDEARRMEVYAAMIDILDQNVGRVIDYLKETGHWDNTLFMFLSDNGASAEVVELGDGLVGAIDRWSSLKSNWANVANTPFRFFKNYSYEGGIITPFIAHWPSGIADAGRIDHTLLHFVDFMPTLIELAGGIYPDKYRDKALPDLPGKSMLPLFRKNEIHRLEPLYFDWANGGALRTNQWKIVRQGDDWELYDMEIDRTETTNLAGSMPEKLHELEQKWQEWNSRF